MNEESEVTSLSRNTECQKRFFTCENLTWEITLEEFIMADSRSNGIYEATIGIIMDSFKVS
jgi:hypothetical protein